MSNKNISFAKEIFVKYGGSHFHMEREGDYEYYKSLGISQEQERLWIKEYQQELLVKIRAENIISPIFSRLTSTIRSYNDFSGLQMVIELANEKWKFMDTFSQMRMAEEILRIVESFINNTEQTKIVYDAKQLALGILNSITVSPITVASYYKDIDYLKDQVKEDTIINRVQRLIRRWEK